jgi:CHASE2 domain-containing sensor protein
MGIVLSCARRLARNWPAECNAKFPRAKFLSQHSRWIIAGFGFLVFGLTQTHWLAGSLLWQKAEGALIDRRYLLRGERPPDPNIILVGLGSSAFQLDALSTNEVAASPTLQLMQQPWPWDRRVYAAVLEKIVERRRAGGGLRLCPWQRCHQSNRFNQHSR